MKRKSGASDPTGRPAKSPRVRGKATVNSKKVGGPTFVGPEVTPEFVTAKKEVARAVPKQRKTSLGLSGTTGKSRFLRGNGVLRDGRGTCDERRQISGSGPTEAKCAPQNATGVAKCGAQNRGVSRGDPGRIWWFGTSSGGHQRESTCLPNFLLKSVVPGAGRGNCRW